MVLGVTCSTQSALLTGVENGEVVETAVYRIDVGAIHEASAELQSTMDEIGRALAQIRPSLVVLLLPEPSKRFKYTHSQIAPRITLETLIRLATVHADIPIDVMTRKTVRSRLGLDFSGDLASHVAERFPASAPPYWSAGRDVAALAAFAGEFS
jgi:hypothetical protein